MGSEVWARARENQTFVFPWTGADRWIRTAGGDLLNVTLDGARIVKSAHGIGCVGPRRNEGSAKGQQPAELRIWKETQLANDIEPAYHDLQQPERGATERSLFAEQTGQCVYCGRKIALDRNQHYHIEHFRPQTEYGALQLDYSNLFPSCGPGSEYGTPNTCGAHKDNWFDEDCHIPPAPESCANRFDSARRATSPATDRRKRTR